MNLLEKLHMLHSVWHYRLRTEKEDINYMMQYDLEGKTVIDIGANRGIYSYWMSKKVGVGGKVFAFEPQPELEKHLLEVKSDFKLHNLFVFNHGLSCQEGVKTLYRPEACSGGATLCKTNGEWQQIAIKVKTLDSYLSEFSHVKFIKCDVEGHEYDVFKGGHRLLERDKPVLLLECHHRDAENGILFQYLQSLGYDGFFLHKGQMIDHQDFDKYPCRKKKETHRNYIFISK
ncbi:MAG: FkbM family methyltransferase [Deltaproteobacteria bacterium]|nr:FkbM family methyltransferase [Deltaproteobacteria bacterium]